MSQLNHGSRPGTSGFSVFDLCSSADFLETILQRGNLSKDQNSALLFFNSLSEKQTCRVKTCYGLVRILSHAARYKDVVKQNRFGQ